jgi:hypothetical protein
MDKYILVTLLALTTSLIVVAIIADNNTLSAKSAYLSGYDHGASDARDRCTNACHWYILKPGKVLPYFCCISQIFPQISFFLAYASIITGI